MGPQTKLLIAFMAIQILGCKTEGNNRSDAYAPASQQCVTPTDQSCVGGAAAMVQVPLPEARDKSLPKSETSIFGRCEMVVEGESSLRSCDGVKLIVRATRENEERTAVIDGYNFKIEDLNQTAYNLQAVSPNYDISTDTKMLNPGQTVKIRIKARPRP